MWRESAKGSHNNLLCTVKDKKIPTEKIIKMVGEGDYSFLSNKDRFLSQLRTFVVEDYPDYDKVISHDITPVTVDQLNAEELLRSINPSLIKSFNQFLAQIEDV
jgi:hypothetical protein